MTDRELLELAAKGAGLDIVMGDNFGTPWPMFRNGTPWNPLTDDGDALRLAVKLHIGLYINAAGCNAGSGSNLRMVDIDDANGDLAAAVRRAIVRCAAELGKTTP